MKLWRAALSYLRIQFAAGFQYRISALSNVSIGVFWGLIQTTLMHVFYTYSSHYTAGLEAGMTLAQAVSYSWLVQAVLPLTPYNADAAIMEKIRNGDVGLELCRPIGLYGHWYARTLSSRIAPFVIRGGITVLVAFLMPEGWRLSPPASATALAAAVTAMTGAVFLIGAIGVFVLTLCLNVGWGQGPMQMLFVVISVMSGTNLPLQLWPDFMQKFLLAQPFAGTVDLPLRLYAGTLEPGAVFMILGLQLVWTAAFALAGQLIMKRSLARLAVQGG